MQKQTLFTLRLFSGLLLAALLLALVAPATPAVAQSGGPDTVTIPGTLQSELGCSDDWKPDCDKTFLTYDAEDDVWQGTFLVQPDNDQDKKGPRYKAAIDKAWGENYGLKAQPNGADIPLVVSEPTEVKFYYDHKTHWVTDNFNTVIAVATGTFQSELGCNNDNDPGCLRSWMQDIEGTGKYTFAAKGLPDGDYEARVALYESADQVYGAGGELNGAAIAFTVKDGGEVFFSYDSSNNGVVVSTEGAPKGNLAKPLAHWVNADTILWKITSAPTYSYELHYALEGNLSLAASGIEGGQMIPLTLDAGGPGAETLEKFPHLDGFTTLKINPADAGKAREILRGQVAILARDDQGKVIDAVGVQFPGALDALFTYRGELGVIYNGNVPTLRLWAPTAQSVSLHLFDAPQGDASQVLAMTSSPEQGTWELTGASDWTGKYYLYEVKVFVPATGKVETNLVTDPYAISLSMNSKRSQIVNLADSALAPSGWESLAKPPLAAFEDSVIYELHIRDFSAYDVTVPEALRGTYKAFTLPEASGMIHLKALADAGLTHIHLLPAFDIASINEDKSTWKNPDPEELAKFSSYGKDQRSLIEQIRDQDGFNWGYDPLHYSTPEGSYATNPEGITRIVEFREMVQALNQAGLRVVMDVVYNHTNASGQNANSVLDRVVPGYYHRLNANGQVETSTCCQNTATEHVMMEKLMIDSLVTWAKYYKVDGFRFDLMGHHMAVNMANVRTALDGLTLEKDGVDGSKILLYGEGWDFGEVAKNARGVNATQLNLGGSGIASFNDRLRDAVRGGGPFNPMQEQGFSTGLFDQPNAYDQGSADSQQAKALLYEDWIKIGMAGNLESYTLVNSSGDEVPGVAISYNGAPAAYTLDPQENIVYAAAHDNETLFDAIQYKAAPEVTIQERVRMNNIALSVVMFSQGIPFFHAGDDLLRSKSLDGNSYNSGDWFNRLDFTYQTNNWGVGVPMSGSEDDMLMGQLLIDRDYKVTPADIQMSASYFQELLKIRRSTPLLRMQTAEDIAQRLSFLNLDPERDPGLIVMVLDDRQESALDPTYDLLVILFNARKDAVEYTDSSMTDLSLALHPLQAESVDERVRESSYDPATGTFSVPGRTTAVFVQARPKPVIEATETPDSSAFTQPEATQSQEPAQAGESDEAFPIAGVLGGAAAVGIAGAALAYWLRKRK
jgi:pullulanase-type alpha-1,6-glucosidase